MNSLLYKSKSSRECTSLGTVSEPVLVWLTRSDWSRFSESSVTDPIWQKSTELWTAVHQRICRHTSPVSLMCHPGRDFDRLLQVSLLSHRSTFPPSENGHFQFPAPTSGTVFHHMSHAHRRSRYSGSVWRHFSSTCHIRIWFSDFPPTSLWTLR